jgi:hypothetical protein
MGRRNITVELLENSPRPAAGSRLILLFFLYHKISLYIYRGG